MVSALRMDLTAPMRAAKMRGRNVPVFVACTRCGCGMVRVVGSELCSRCRVCPDCGSPDSYRGRRCERCAGKRARERDRARNGSPERRAKNAHRQGMRRASLSDISAADVRVMLASARTCPLCRCRLVSDKASPRGKHLDHIIPVSLGGTHTHGNVRVVCRSCNLARGGRGDDLDGFQPTLWATAPGVVVRAPMRKAMVANSCVDCGEPTTGIRCRSCSYAVGCNASGYRGAA